MRALIDTTRRLISVRGANLRNCHLYIAGHHDFFPAECYGAPKAQEGRGAEITLLVDGIPEPIRTDIPKDTNNRRPRSFFRNRTWVGRFLEAHQLREGDIVAIEKCGHLTYRVYPFERRSVDGEGESAAGADHSGQPRAHEGLFAGLVNESLVSRAKSVVPAEAKPVNVSKVRQLSPFRYPGGKTWLMPELRRWIWSLGHRPTVFVEPFAGGGIASLTVAIEDLSDKVIMCELDPDVASVWETILEEPEYLSERILAFDVTPTAVRKIIASEPKTTRDRAFQTIVRNRVQRGGILAHGASLVKRGENGKGLKSRWYPETLVRRISLIHKHRHRIEFVTQDGFHVIEKYRTRSRAVFFVDPPYTAGGKKAGRRLYTCSELDHEKLFAKMATVAGAFLMTYDDTEEVRGLASRWGFALSTIPMKNTHHTVNQELLIKKS